MNTGRVRMNPRWDHERQLGQCAYFSSHHEVVNRIYNFLFCDDRALYKPAQRRPQINAFTQLQSELVSGSLS